MPIKLGVVVPVHIATARVKVVVKGLVACSAPWASRVIMSVMYSLGGGYSAADRVSPCWWRVGGGGAGMEQGRRRVARERRLPCVAWGCTRAGGQAGQVL